MDKTIAIIGGGVAGLAAAGLLSKEGLRVHLFEANPSLGGCCATTTIDGYTFNNGALYVPLPGVLDHVFARLGMDRRDVLPMRKILANQTTKLPDGTTISFGEGLDVRINGEAQSDRARQLHDDLEKMLAKWQPVLRLFADDLILHPLSYSKLLLKGWRHLHKFRGTVASEIRRLFTDEAVRAAMSGVLLYTGSPPQQMPVMQVIGLLAMLTEGLYLPEGGMGRIPEALSQAPATNGAHVHLNAQVRGIVIKAGRICGLDVDGQGFVAADAVLSTVSGMLTFQLLAGAHDVPEPMRKKALAAPLSHKALSIQLGLANAIDAPSYSNSILPLMDQQHEVFAADGTDLKWLNYTVPTLAMPSLAPPGRSTIEMFLPINQDIPIDDWDEPRKQQALDSAIAALSRLHKIDVAVQRVRTPKDFRDTMHLYAGSLYGLSPAADPRSQFPHSSPIPGLYQAGQTTYPGFGVGAAAMSGILAAEAIIAQ